MANCHLTIEVDDPRKPRSGGESVTGTVVVTTTGPVQCKGLEVTSYWSTHGRGNIDRGDVDQVVLFQGQWDSSQEYRYKFTLKTATWPPTYYGTLLNVSHAVRVRAQIPWSTDPTANAEFPVVALNPPEDLKPPDAVSKKPKSIVGWVIGAILLLIILPLLSLALLFLIVPVAIFGGGYWFVRVFLPRQVTGSIECTIEPKRVTAGDTVRGSLRFTPKRNMTINSIHWTVTCGEKCTSGSGSDRKTHLHEIHRQGGRLSESAGLRVGEPQAFEFSFQVPNNAPPSLKFSNNELNWVSELRIDIARWPDWVQTVPLAVTASSEMATAAARLTGDPAMLPTASPEEEWFYEVLRQIERCQNDRMSLQTVLDAVRDQVFTVRVDLEDTLEEPPPSARGEIGSWRIASTVRSNLELALLWKRPDQPPAASGDDWCGKGVILGFDESIDCLLLRVVPAAGK